MVASFTRTKGVRQGETSEAQGMGRRNKAVGARAPRVGRRPGWQQKPTA